VPLRELLDDRLLDALAERSRDAAGGLRLTGECSMLGELVKAVLERALEAELTAHHSQDHDFPSSTVAERGVRGCRPRAELGAELAAYRRAAGYSQAQLAQLSGYSRSAIANVETGRERIPRNFRERADAALHTGGTLATGHDELETAQRNELRAAAHQASTARQAHAPPHLDSPGGSHPAEGFANGHGAYRHPLASWRPAGPALPIAAEFDALPRLGNGGGRAGRETAPRQVNPGDVVRLRGMRAPLKAIDNAHGGGAALPMAPRRWPGLG
jgi:transcriptional regulator with XRE-family HTH domain